MKPLALTMGEPAGIGGELTLAAWHRLKVSGPPFVAIDDPDRLAALAAQLRTPTPIHTVRTAAEAPALFADALAVLPISERVPSAPGKAIPETAHAVTESIERAVRLAEAGTVSGIVTNPIHKAVLMRAGFAFPGHTEFLAALSGAPRSVMMLAGPTLRVVPVTVHIPLAEVPEALSADAIVETARITDEALRRDFAVAKPRLVTAGLNPHAGEDGRLGSEDEAVIAPAVATLRRDGLDIVGPLSADTLFHPAARKRYDAAICMYHDQALIPIKTIAFDEGVNVTLGLPFVRTSPDHGTALDIAGQGLARADSLIAAISLAARLSANRARKLTA